MRLWEGRFRKPRTDLDAWQASYPVDRRLWSEEVEATHAYAEALYRVGWLTDAEWQALDAALTELKTQPPPEGDYEDVHTALEVTLTQRLGDPGRKVATGRSRNEDVVVIEKLFLRRAIDTLIKAIRTLQGTLVDQADRHLEIIVPGYTHLRQAQPITWGFYLMNWFFALERDRDRFLQARRRMDTCPYGSGALAGSTVPFDRTWLARQLGFKAPAPNALDAVEDRDYLLDFLVACGFTALHLARMAEDWIVFSSDEFGWLELDETLTTSSSLLPHKKNPDLLELVRALAGLVWGDITALAMVLKGLPSGYNKDLQWDKMVLFRTYDGLRQALEVMERVVGGTRVRTDVVQRRLDPHTLTVDLVDVLVQQGMPFREAHRRVARFVAEAEAQGRSPDTFSPQELQVFFPEVKPDALNVWDPKAAVARRNGPEGTAPDAVRAQIAHARRLLQE